MNTLRTFFVSLLVLNTITIEAKEHPLTPTTTESQTQYSLMYVSDYFVFIGSDETGQIIFALDNNRGKDRETLQAEHLLVLLHNGAYGWAELEGQGSFANVTRQLTKLPNSPSFQFQGTPARGITISSPTNKLTLKVDPVPERQTRTHHMSKYWMGSASGTLEWQGRIVNGIVIYEHLWMPGFNRLTHRYTDLWTESHGLYLSIGDRDDHLYLHSQKDATRLSPLIGDQVGFSVFSNNGEQMKNLQLKVLKRQHALGFYRWPTRWEGSWENSKGKGSLTIHITDLKVISNYLIGGLAMGIVTGEVTFNGRPQPIYGLVEVLI